MQEIDLKDVQAWTVSDVTRVIQGLLPVEATMNQTYRTEGYYEVFVEIPGKSSLFEQHVDLKIALLNVFWALYAKPKITDPRWVVRESPENPPPIKNRDPVEDPADLDPESVEAVYRPKL